MPKKQGMSSFQKEAQSTDKYTDPTAPTFLAVPFLSMTEEAGQLARIYKEIVVSGNKLSEFQQKEIKDKLGDLLWYIANIAKKLNIDLDTVAIANLQKTKKLINCPSQKLLLKILMISMIPIIKMLKYPKDKILLNLNLNPNLNLNHNWLKLD